MTQDEAKRLEEVRSEVSTLRRDVSAVQADVAAIRAVTDALGQRRDAEADALWGKHNAIGDRLGVVERDYLPKRELDAFRVAQAAADQKRDEQIAELRGKLAYYVGMGVAICAVINFLGVGGMAAIVFWGAKAGGAH